MNTRVRHCILSQISPFPFPVLLASLSTVLWAYRLGDPRRGLPMTAYVTSVWTPRITTEVPKHLSTVGSVFKTRRPQNKECVSLQSAIVRCHGQMETSCVIERIALTLV